MGMGGGRPDRKEHAQGEMRPAHQSRESKGWKAGDEFGQALGDGDGQRSLVCCSLWGHKELDMTERLNNNVFLRNRTHLIFIMFI